jgi:hypothetical protein
MTEEHREPPSEVAEVWGRLHQEAQDRYNDLTPKTSKRARIIAILSVSAAVVILLGFSLWLQLVFRPEERHRQITATAQAIAQATEIGQTKIAINQTAIAAEVERSATVTAEEATRNRAIVAQDATATARAETLNAAATARVKTLNATETAVAQASRSQATATAYAVATGAAAKETAEACQKAAPYKGTIQVLSPQPTLQPLPSFNHVVGDPPPAVRATWIISYTGGCPLESIRLLGKGNMSPVVPQVSRKGERWEVTLAFNIDTAPNGDQEWLILVGDMLISPPTLNLKLPKPWIVRVTPTPSPTPTPTPTPAEICREETYECRCTTGIDPITGTVTRNCEECTRKVCVTSTP